MPSGALLPVDDGVPVILVLGVALLKNGVLWQLVGEGLAQTSQIL